MHFSHFIQHQHEHMQLLITEKQMHRVIKSSVYAKKKWILELKLWCIDDMDIYMCISMGKGPCRKTRSTAAYSQSTHVQWKQQADSKLIAVSITLAQSQINQV